VGGLRERVTERLDKGACGDAQRRLFRLLVVRIALGGKVFHAGEGIARPVSAVSRNPSSPSVRFRGTLKTTVRVVSVTMSLTPMRTANTDSTLERHVELQQRLATPSRLHLIAPCSLRRQWTRDLE